MPALARFNEYNGQDASETTGITNANFGVHDQPNITPANSVIERGTNSFSKWWKVDFYGGTFNRISNIRCWRGNATFGDGPELPAGLSVRGRSAYPGDLPYAQPTRDVQVTTELPRRRADAIQVGPAELTAPGKSSYINAQLVTTAAAPTGDVALGFICVSWQEE